MSMANTDVELLRRFARDRNELAFADLMGRHEAAVRAVGRRILQDHAGADDVAQTTFAELARRGEELASRGSPDGSLGGWLHRVAYHAAVREKARNASRRSREIAVGSQAPESPLDEEGLAAVAEELAALPAEHLAPLELVAVRGMTLKASAAALGVSLAVFRKRLDRARNALRVRLERRGVVAAAAIVAALLPSTRAAAAAGAAVKPAAVLGMGAAFVAAAVLVVSAACRPPTIVNAPAPSEAAAEARTEKNAKTDVAVQESSPMKGTRTAAVAAAALSAALLSADDGPKEPKKPPARPPKQAHNSSFHAVLNINGELREFNDPVEAEKAFRDAGMSFGGFGGFPGGAGNKNAAEHVAEKGLVIQFKDKQQTEKLSKAFAAVANKPLDAKAPPADYDLAIDGKDGEADFFAEVDFKQAQTWLGKWLLKMKLRASGNKADSLPAPTVEKDSIVLPTNDPKDAAEVDRMVEAWLSRPGTIKPADRGECKVRLLLREGWFGLSFSDEKDLSRARPIAEKVQKATNSGGGGNNFGVPFGPGGGNFRGFRFNNGKMEEFGGNKEKNKGAKGN